MPLPKSAGRGKGWRLARGYIEEATSTPTPAPAPAPTLSVSSSVSQAEGNSGTTTVTSIFTVNRDSVIGPMQINLTHTGTATAGVDYLTPPTSIEVVAGQNTATLTTVINGDTVNEGNETIIVGGTIAGYPAAIASRTITITNDDVGTAPTTNEALIATIPTNGTAILAMLAGSRARQNNQGTTNEIRSVTSGPITFAEAIGRRVRAVVYSSTALDQTSPLIGGTFFANDGEGSSAAYQRVPAVIASDAQLCVVELSSNSVQLNNFNIYGTDLGTALTAEGYIENYKTICLALIAGGTAVAVNDLWERNTLAGGLWASGGSRRALVPAINAAMKAWCATQGIPFIELRPLLIDPASNDNNPYTSVVRSDGTHYSTIGAYIAGVAYDAFFASLGWQSRADTFANAGNLATNPTLTGTSGAPTGYTLSQVGTLAAVTTATIAKGGKQWLEWTLNANNLGSTQEGVRVQAPAPTTEVGKWYQATAKFELDAWDAWYGAPTVVGSAGANVAKGLVPVNNGGSGVTDLADVGMLKGPSGAYTGTLSSPPFKATTTVGSFRIDMPAFRQSAAIGRVRVAELEFREVADPTLVTYDESIVTVAAFTTPNSYSTPENVAFETFVAGNVPLRYSLGTGSDVASAALDKWGRLRIIPIPDFETKTSYVVPVIGTPYDPTKSPVPMTITVNITDVNDGFVDAFSGVENSDAALRSGWTPIGLANALQIRSNRVYNNTSSGAARGGMLAPQQGDTIDQRVEWTAPTTSQGANICCQILDENNWIGCRLNSAVPRIIICQNGVEAFQPAVSPYKPVATSDLLTFQRLNNTVTLYSNNVPVTSADVTGIFTNVKRSGIVSNISGSTSNQTIDNFRAVTASPITPKIALATLTLVNDIAVAGQEYAGTVSGLTGTPQAYVAVDASALFFMDGFNLRTNGPVASGTYTVSVDEPNDNAATPNPKRTTFVIVIP